MSESIESTHDSALPTLGQPINDIDSDTLRSVRETASLDKNATGLPQAVAQSTCAIDATPQSNWETTAKPVTNVGDGLRIRCPQCKNSFQVMPEADLSNVECPSCGGSFNLIETGQSADRFLKVARIGHFDLIERLGSGAFGTVWSARDTELDRTVAVKIPRKGQMSAAGTEMFLREARAAAQLRHPNIVSVHEVGWESDVVYLVSDLVQGKSLHEWLDGQFLGNRDAAELCAKIARALQHAHDNGVIHRDLKPQNILMDSAGQPHVTDFGLARRKAAEITMTMEGQLLGTPAYMSPEQARGDSHTADQRSDVYSMGVILFELLTAELPFRGNLRALLHQVLYDDPPSPRLLNNIVAKDLETITLHCLAKDPAHRYQSAAELADELERHLRGEPIYARPVTRAERAWLWCRRYPALASSSAATVLIASVAFATVTWQLIALKKAEYERAVSQANELTTASPDTVPSILANLKPRWPEIAPRLRQMLIQSGLSKQQECRIRLALLPDDPNQTDQLLDGIFHADPHEFALIRDAVLSYGKPVSESMWQILDNEGRGADERFRAAAFLAADHQKSPARWKEHTEFVAKQLVATIARNPADYQVLLDSLRPAHDQLLPTLTSIFQDASRTERDQDIVTHVLADYEVDERQTLERLLLDSRPAQFSVLFSVLANDRHRDQAKADLLEFLVEPPSKAGDPEELDRRAKQQANAAIALVQMGVINQLGGMLNERGDASSRSYFIDRFKSTGSKPDSLFDLLAKKPENHIRRALYLTLGTFSIDDIAPEPRFTKEEFLTEYQADPDPGIHSALRWMLAQWGLGKQLDQMDAELSHVGGIIGAKKQWFVNSTRHTMLIHGPGEFVMGSPEGEPGRLPDEHVHQRRIDRTFAIAMFETTIAQFQQLKEPDSKISKNIDPSCPINYVGWSDAAAYCNWLSKKEDIPRDQWCYVPTAANPELLMPAEKFLDLQGYRLPTEAEWEYSCRAGSTTARFFGNSDELLPDYAWCPRNSPRGDKQPVGLKKPNPFGLFDIYGNALEWCHDYYKAAYPTGPQTQLDRGGPELPTPYRVLRGSAAGDTDPPRSAQRDEAPFSEPGINAMGFRVAKTINSGKVDDN